MKMLTGLLDASSGSAKLLGKSIDAKDMHVRQQVGYMSQAFSLYEELSVRQNLVLHAKLYQLSGKTAEQAIASALVQFELQDLADELPRSLSLGVRQRLQLAAACLHRPTVLILDEPTSGVDPAARDKFWQYLLKLSRDDRVTIFISTHFMNEALRCDRISFMHRGQVLAVGTPQALQQQRQAATLEEAFIAFLTEQQEQPQQSYKKQSKQQIKAESKTAIEAQTPAAPPPPSTNDVGRRNKVPKFGLSYWFYTVWTFALREGKELLRDPIRLLFSILGPIILLLVDSWGLSFDANRINFAVLDQDRSYESRELIEHFAGSAYFKQVAQLSERSQLTDYLSGEKSRLILEIPSGFGRHLLQQQRPEVAFYIDGSMPFTGENAVTYTTTVIRQYTQDFYKKRGINLQPPYDLQVRMMYNQAFKSVNAISP
ncbi:MAG: multidrug ABC transporter ATP-binding protein, partial [Gammaproteobacteria bacterium]